MLMAPDRCLSRAAESSQPIASQGPTGAAKTGYFRRMPRSQFEDEDYDLWVDDVELVRAPR
ncbi:MAG TPA: hypothetical protein VIW29_07920 [Polyangiaceae bacterium]